MAVKVLVGIGVSVGGGVLVGEGMGVSVGEGVLVGRMVGKAVGLTGVTVEVGGLKAFF